MPSLSQQESLIEDALKFYFNVVEDNITGNHFYNFNVYKPFTNDLTKLLNQEEDGVFLAHQFVTRNNSSSLLFCIPVILASGVNLFNNLNHNDSLVRDVVLFLLAYATCLYALSRDSSNHFFCILKSAESIIVCDPALIKKSQSQDSDISSLVAVSRDFLNLEEEVAVFNNKNGKNFKISFQGFPAQSDNKSCRAITEDLMRDIKTLQNSEIEIKSEIKKFDDLSMEQKNCFVTLLSLLHSQSQTRVHDFLKKVELNQIDFLAFNKEDFEMVFSSKINGLEMFDIIDNIFRDHFPVEDNRTKPNFSTMVVGNEAHKFAAKLDSKSNFP